MAAVEEIIHGLNLSLSNTNSYNYCGSIRLKRPKKKCERERERGNVCHPQKCSSTMLAQLGTKGRAQSHTKLRLSPFCMVSKKNKNCQPSKYFISAFPHKLPFFHF